MPETRWTYGRNFGLGPRPLAQPLTAPLLPSTLDAVLWRLRGSYHVHVRPWRSPPRYLLHRPPSSSCPPITLRAHCLTSVGLALPGQLRCQNSRVKLSLVPWRRSLEPLLLDLPGSEPTTSRKHWPQPTGTRSPPTWLAYANCLPKGKLPQLWRLTWAGPGSTPSLRKTAACGPSRSVKPFGAWSAKCSVTQRGMIPINTSGLCRLESASNWGARQLFTPLGNGPNATPGQQTKCFSKWTSRMRSTVWTALLCFPKPGRLSRGWPAGWIGAIAPPPSSDLASTPFRQPGTYNKVTPLGPCCFLRPCSQRCGRLRSAPWSFVFRTWMMQCSPAEPTQWLLPSGSFNKKPQRPVCNLNLPSASWCLWHRRLTSRLSRLRFKSGGLACLTSWAPRSATLIIATLSLKRSGWRRRPNAWKLWLRCRTLRLGSNFFAIAFPSQKKVHSMRTTPPGAHASALAAFDQQHRGCLEHLGCFPVSDRTWHQATLGLKQGGLGLRQCTVHAPAAYLASVAATHEACRSLDGRYTPDWPSSVQAAAAFDAAVLASDRFHGVHQPRQQTLSAALDKAQLAQLQVSAEGESERAHLQLLQQPGAGAWLLARPSKALGLHLDAAFFRVLLRMRLRVPVASSDGYCPLCDGIADRFGDHARACPCGGDRTKRHNRLRAVVAARARAAGLSPEVEKQGLLPQRPEEHGASESGGWCLHPCMGGPWASSFWSRRHEWHARLSASRLRCVWSVCCHQLRREKASPSEHGAALPRPRPPVRASCGWSLLGWVGPHRFCHLEKTWGVAWSLHRADGVPGRWAAASSLVCGLAARKRKSRAPALAPSRRRLLLRSALVGWPCQRPRLAPASAWVSDAFFVSACLSRANSCCLLGGCFPSLRFPCRRAGRFFAGKWGDSPFATAAGHFAFQSRCPAGIADFACLVAHFSLPFLPYIVGFDSIAHQMMELETCPTFPPETRTYVWMRLGRLVFSMLLPRHSSATTGCCFEGTTNLVPERYIRRDFFVFRLPFVYCHI